MKLLAGAIAYLSVVTIVIVVAFASLSTIERRQPDDATATLGSSAGNQTAQREREQPDANADRVPVWIVPTAKYVYTPVPVDLKPKPAPVIGQDARAAMARGPKADGRMAIERALRDQGRGPALGFARSRDNNPFFRD